MRILDWKKEADGTYTAAIADRGGQVTLSGMDEVPWAALKERELLSELAELNAKPIAQSREAWLIDQYHAQQDDKGAA